MGLRLPQRIAPKTNFSGDTPVDIDGSLVDTSTGVAIGATQAEIDKLDRSVADIYADGVGVPGIAQATWDFAVDGGAIEAIDLGVNIPANSIILGGVLDVQTTLTSTATGTDKATIAISVASANDIVDAVAIETGTPWDQGLQTIVPVFTAATYIKTTVIKPIVLTIAVAAVLTGKLTIQLHYVPTLVDV
jgi:hypothetical protein